MPEAHEADAGEDVALHLLHDEDDDGGDGRLAPGDGGTTDSAHQSPPAPT